MLVIIVTTKNSECNKEILLRVERAVKQVFGSGSILPLGSGTIVKIVPAFRRYDSIAEPLLHVGIYFPQKRNMTAAVKVNAVKELERLIGGTVTMNAQPKKLWREITL